MRTILTALFALTLATMAQGQIYGQQDTAYQSARTAWLEGQDMAALTALSKLAKTGNTAAQILLAQIQPNPHMHAHVTKALDRKERIALLRQPKGLSGTSWLKEAAKTEPVAQAYFDIKLQDPAKQTAAGILLLDKGDMVSALAALMNQLRYGNLREASALLEHPALPAEHAAFPLFARSEFPGQPKAPYPTLAQRLLWNGVDPSRIWNADTAGKSELTETVFEMEVYAPLRQFCEERCPKSDKACTLTAQSLLTSANPLGPQTPTPLLISQAEYVASPRYKDDLSRLAQLSFLPDKFRKTLDQCALDALR